MTATNTSSKVARLIHPYFMSSPTEDDVFETVEWEKRDAEVKGSGFSQKDVEVPKSWSENATNIVAQKYFRGRLGTDERETSVRQIIGRVANTITVWGIRQGYFGSTTNSDDMWGPAAQIFYNELAFILLHQIAAFNSPVWFNVGFEEEPQCSACFILSTEDTLDSILDWNTKEGNIFRGGSGSGTDLSKIRGSMEPLSKGGYSSGPVSFMRGADAWAGTIASGGKTRRAAKMVTLAVDHPNIVDYVDEHGRLHPGFINVKAVEEERLAIMKEAGLINGIDETAAVGSYQNANNTVRVTEDFMRLAVEDNDEPNWSLVGRSRHKQGETIRKVNAGWILEQIAKAAWRCADPGMQWDTLINEWHTSPATGRINSSNPCSEYMHVDDSACNLASINLLKMRCPDGSFDTVRFRHVVDVMITAQDILVDASSYPTEEIKKNAHTHHQLGLGYTNLGAYLMSVGLPYDSSQGRDLAAAITSMMTARAYVQGARIASILGPYLAWGNISEGLSKAGKEVHVSNASAHMDVLRKHASAGETLTLKTTGHTSDIAKIAAAEWNACLSLTSQHGQRIAQATVLAPTGTISFLMDCDTTGVEPSFGLVQYKDLAGGGSLVLANRSVSIALENLGYSPDAISLLENNLMDGQTDAFLNTLKSDEHREIFAGANDISPKGHIKMMGAVQPFISGAISKTVNMPESTTWQEVRDAYILAWHEGVKALAIYRDGSKGAAPLSTKVKVEDSMSLGPTPARRRLPTTRTSITHKFSIGGFEGYITAGLYPDGSLGEIFLNDIGKDGSTLLGMTNAFATEISTSLQYGKPVEEIVLKHANRTFEPRGVTTNPEIPIASSIVDYVAKWIASQFCSPEIQAQLGLRTKAALTLNGIEETLEAGVDETMTLVSDLTRGELGPACGECGAIMQRAGACYVCRVCGSNTGCG